MDEPEDFSGVEAHHRRRRIWIALAVTAVAVPVLVMDNLSTANDEPAVATTTRVVVAAPTSAGDRPDTGPLKGISVVTSSTTSSTLPITPTTTPTSRPT